MSGSNLGDWFGGSGFGSFGGQNRGRGGMGQGWPGGNVIQEAMDQLRGMFEQRPATRMGKGDVRAAVLALLAEKPMHGYQIIAEIDERSGGSWKPSPGSVYPTLQLLADEGLITAEESNGRKTYSLTEEGRFVADAAGDQAAPWQTSEARDSGRPTAIAKAGIDLAQAAAQVARTGTPEQVKAAVSVLEDARRKLFSILAQD